MSEDSRDGTMRRYGDKRSPKVLAFIEAVDDLCLEYSMTLSHEDQHGSFEIIVGPPTKAGRDWFKAAAEIAKAQK